MLALVTGVSSGTVVIHRVSIILPQEFIPYQPDSRIFSENPNTQKNGAFFFPPFCHSRRLSPTFVIGDPVSEGIQRL